MRRGGRILGFAPAYGAGRFGRTVRDAPESFTRIEKNRIIYLFFNFREIFGLGMDEDRLPLTPFQEHIWLHQQFDPDSPVYNVFLFYRITGDLDPGALESAISDVIERHEALRTRVRFQEDQPYQVVDEAVDFRLEHHDLTGMAEQNDENALWTLVRHVSEQAFQLENELPIKSVLIQTGPDEWRWLTIIHHLFVDSWSESVFLNEIKVGYRARRHGTGPGLPDLPIQYGDYALWLTDPEQKTTQEKNVAEWERYLKGAGRIRIDFGESGNDARVFSGGVVRRLIRFGEYERLEKVSGEQGASPFQFCLAVFFAWIHRLTGQNDIVAGTPVTVRDQPELRNLIGLFINVLPVRCQVTGELAFSELVRRVKAASVSAFRLKLTPLSRILELAPEDENVASRTLNTCFVFDPKKKRIDGFEGLEIERIELPEYGSKFDLTLYIQPMPDSVWLTVEYASGMFEEGEVEKLADLYRSMLTALTHDATQRLDSIQSSGIEEEALRGIHRRSDGAAAAESTPPASPEVEERTFYGEMEGLMLAIWRRLLGRPDLGVDDDFFSSGGDSLNAIRLLAIVRRRMGVEIALNEVFRHPTVRRLARRIYAGRFDGEYRSLVPLQPNGSKPPLYVIHGFGGELFVFVELARLLGEDLPVYGLQAVEWSGERESHNSIESAAQHYADEIMSFQPDGPYRLAGFCMGGNFAYETARQLRMRGKGVGFLGILDSVPPNLPRLLYYRCVLPHYVHSVFHHTRNLALGKVGDWRKYLKDRRKTLWFMWRAFTMRKRGNEAFENTRGTGKYYYRLIHQYKPAPADLRVSLFVADGHRYRLERMWKHLAREGVEARIFTGGHAGFFDEANVGAFAKLFREALDESEPDS